MPPPEFGCCGALAFSRQDSSSLSPCIRRTRGYFEKVTVCVRFFFFPFYRDAPNPPLPTLHYPRFLLSWPQISGGASEGERHAETPIRFFFGFADSIVEVRAARARRTRTVDKHTESGRGPVGSRTGFGTRLASPGARARRGRRREQRLDLERFAREPWERGATTRPSFSQRPW